MEEYRASLDVEGYREYMMSEKVLDFLLENAVVTDVEPETEAAEAETTETGETEEAETETAETESAAETQTAEAETETQATETGSES